MVQFNQQRISIEVPLSLPFLEQVSKANQKKLFKLTVFYIPFECMESF